MYQRRFFLMAHTHWHNEALHCSAILVACLLSVKSRSPPPKTATRHPPDLFPSFPPCLSLGLSEQWPGHRIQSFRAFSSFSDLWYLLHSSLHHPAIPFSAGLHSHFGPAVSHFRPPRNFGPRFELWYLLHWKKVKILFINLFENIKCCWYVWYEG